MVAAKSRSFKLSTAATVVELHHVSTTPVFLVKRRGGGGLRGHFKQRRCWNGLLICWHDFDSVIDVHLAQFWQCPWCTLVRCTLLFVSQAAPSTLDRKPRWHWIPSSRKPNFLALRGEMLLIYVSVSDAMKLNWQFCYNFFFIWVQQFLS